jgi:mycofactocin precursor
VQLSISFREVKKMTDKEKLDPKPSEVNTPDQERKDEDEIFSTTEIKIEEMSIDGICGVY